MATTVVVGIFAVFALHAVAALDNGLALTPPMGWMSWERFRCLTDCKIYPDECISEQLITRTADLMVSEGYADLGYEYVIIDDCWLSHDRDSEGRLQPDPDRFPNGIKAVADYVHSKGLKFGIYEDYGNYTCGGYPGVMNNLELDAQTLAGWEVDYIKLDGCYADLKDMKQGYTDFGSYLNKSGRPIVYSCSWPAYQQGSGEEPDFETLKEICNLWRNYGDIGDDWADVVDIMKFFADNQSTIAPQAGPGHWNDPDMIIVGNFGLSFDQSKVQMAIWSILAAPLLMSTELRDVKPEFKAILQNKDVIAVSQDELGIQGIRVQSQDDIEIWTRPISPVSGEDYSYAVAFVSRRTDGYPYPKSVNLTDIGLNHSMGYMFQDLYNPDSLPIQLKPESELSVRINPTGVVFYRATGH